MLGACGRWGVFHSPSFTASKGENFSTFSTKDIVHITEEPDYHSGIAGLALLEVRFGVGGGEGGEKKLLFAALPKRALVTTRYLSNIKQTPKSQHDILSMMYYCFFCQRSAHLNSWLRQELETHPFTGVQPPYKPCLHFSLSAEILPLHPKILQVFSLFAERTTIHFFLTSV